MNLKFEVVDTNLNYNLLLGRSWTHAMVCVVFDLFRILFFPYQGKIVIVDQLAFFSSYYSTRKFPYVGNTTTPYENIGPGLFKDSSLMGIFSLPPRNVVTII